jgi:hypothetical protein
VSELLQSQLLQPTNITPIQPQLAESNLFLISAQGPGSLSFNEFNPIFNRNGASAQVSGLAGENDTFGAAFVLSAIQNKLSWSFGATAFQTDGWRDNADQDDKIFDGFMQYELSYKTSIQAEYRYRDLERGDLRLEFFEDNFFPSERTEERRKTFRLGARHSFSPGSILLGSFLYQDADIDITDPDSFYTADYPEDAYGGELQHLFRSQYVNLVTGGGYFDIDGKIDQDIFGFPLPRVDTDAEHTNVYLYSYINVLDNLTFTVGGSYDDFDADDELTKDQDQYNPKFGITWNPLPGTTLRGAAFRVLKRTLITDQTLEPTQVAGFNQFFDEADTTDYWIFGGALDQKFTESLYGGAEYTYRDLNVPYTFIDPFTFEESLENENVEEKTVRAYLFWTLHDWLALRAEYQFERLETEGEIGPTQLDTHRAPVGLNFFHPSGLSASVTTTYIYQDVDDLTDFSTFTVESDDEDFWLVDAAINYRLPKRYGFFTLGVTNLTDEKFKFYDRDVDNPSIQPDRTIFGKITLALP